MLVSNGYSTNRRKVTNLQTKGSDFFWKDGSLTTVETSYLEQNSVSAIGPGGTTGFTDFNYMIY